MKVAIRMYHSITDSLGFFRDPLRADGSPVATLVRLGPGWHLYSKRVMEITFYCFYKYTYGSLPQDEETPVTIQEEAILGGCVGVPLSHSHLPQ